MDAIKERTTTITVRMPESMKEQIDALARVTGRQRSFLALDAIRKYLELETWQLEEITSAIRRADAGEFASEVAGDAVREKFRVPEQA